MGCWSFCWAWCYRWEDSANDPGDFLVGTMEAGNEGGGDAHCYGRGYVGVTNCWGSYDGHGNMCTHLGPTSGYAASSDGYW